LRELREIIDIIRELVALVFDRLIGLQRRSLVRAEPIDLFAYPDQPL
jgi:hypothetical protein